MMNGTSPSESFSAVEKNVAYVGYWAMLATTTLASSTSTDKPARIAEIAAASPHGPAPTIRRSTVVILSEAKDDRCHPERSEGPVSLRAKQVLRFAQDDNRS